MSDFACRARSKLSITGSRDLIVSTLAKSRKSCCSLLARRRAFSNSACARARRSSSTSRSAFTFCNCASAVATSLSGVDVPPVASEEFWSSSPAGSLCSTSKPDSSVSRFPFDFTMTAVLLRFIQNLVEEARNVRHSRDRVLVIHAGGANDGERAHYFVAGMRRRAYQHEILHGGQLLIQPDYHSHGLLFHVQIGAQQLNDLFLLLQGLQHFLDALAILLRRDQLGS